jgi:Ca2+-binding RTX toxin-like protein
MAQEALFDSIFLDIIPKHGLAVPWGSLHAVWRNAMLPRIDLLESRKLLSASLSGGVLRAIGDTGVANEIKVGLNDLGTQVEVEINGVQSLFNPADVRLIIVHGRELGDTLTVDDDLTTRAIIFGNDGNDTIRGGAGRNQLWGGAGNDTLTARGTRNLVEAGSGNDLIDGSDGPDFILAGIGDDTVNAGNGKDIVWGAAGNDSITAGDGADIVLAGRGNDTVNGGGGNDWIAGEAGDDSLSGGDGDDRLYGLRGNDTLLGGNGNDTLFGGADSDVLDGGDGNNVIRQAEALNIVDILDSLNAVRLVV